MGKLYEFMSEDSGPYLIQKRDGSRKTVVDTRQEVFDVLDAMDVKERWKVTVTVDWRTEDGGYVWDCLRTQVQMADEESPGV